jgi:hypothetical protein
MVIKPAHQGILDCSTDIHCGLYMALIPSYNLSVTSVEFVPKKHAMEIFLLEILRTGCNSDHAQIEAESILATRPVRALILSVDRKPRIASERAKGRAPHEIDSIDPGQYTWRKPYDSYLGYRCMVPIQRQR